MKIYRTFVRWLQLPHEDDDVETREFRYQRSCRLVKGPRVYICTAYKCLLLVIKSLISATAGGVQCKEGDCTF